MEAVTLADLGPIIAAILGPMLAFAVVSMRYQHHDSTKTRELISNSEKEARKSDKETRELISNSEKETRELISNSEKETRELISQVISNSEKETRELISNSEKETRELIERSSKETREEATRQLERATDLLRGDFEQHKRITEKNHDTSQQQFDKLADCLGDVRERLGRIEGHLGIGAPPQQDDKADKGNRDAA